jgi:diphthamide synthase subunit DPH2
MYDFDILSENPRNCRNKNREVPNYFYIFCRESFSNIESVYKKNPNRRMFITYPFKSVNKKVEEDTNISLFKRYATILAVGEQKDLNVLYKYTPKQLKEEYEMYQKKVAFDNYVAARLAGATDIDEPDNWME